MPKFYVESGNLKLVVHAHHARAAAIWATHRVMSQTLPFLADEEPATRREPTSLGALMTTSEQGFGRTDASVHDTFAVVSEWNRLMIALDKLQDAVSSEATAV